MRYLLGYGSRFAIDRVIRALLFYFLLVVYCYRIDPEDPYILIINTKAATSSANS